LIVEEQVDVGLLGAGLVAGIYVRMNGYQAQIFEQPISRAVYLLPTGAMIIPLTPVFIFIWDFGRDNPSTGFTVSWEYSRPINGPLPDAVSCQPS